MDVMENTILMTAVSSTCGLNSEKMAPLPSIRMAKSLTSMALQAWRRTRLSKTWRPQALPLRPRSGKDGFRIAMVWWAIRAIRMGFNLQSPMLLSMHHKGSNLDHRRPHALGLLPGLRGLLLVGTRQSRRQATQISVWICQVIMRSMGTFCGCGIVMEKSRSAGSLTMDRFALALMSQSALMRGTCRLESSCSCGIATVILSKRGVGTPMRPGLI